MFRTWLSRFYRNNKVKIDKIAKLFGLLIVIGICAGMFISFSDTKPANEEKPKEIYKPKDVTISGGEVTDKQFEEQNALIKEFVESEEMLLSSLNADSKSSKLKSSSTTKPPICMK